jgi:hypothetical protein
MASLRIVRGPVSGTLLPLADEQGLIGRDPYCQAVFPDPTVSRRHARISRSPDGFFLEPLVGYNGTYLNGQRMSGPRPLRDGDCIRLGETEMVFESPEKPPTEADWLGASNPQLILNWLRAGGGASERRLRLFAAACCRRFGLLDWLPHAVADMDRVEWHAEGGPPDPNLVGNDHAYAEFRADAWKAATGSIRLAGRARPGRFEEGVQPAAAVLCELVREVFGNPCRPKPAITPQVLRWNDCTVERLAQAAYEDRLLPAGHLDRVRLAILADALEEAGCTDADILGHLRGPGPHVRGCHAVNLLLGRE